jgi:hypothetical protein
MLKHLFAYILIGCQLSLVAQIPQNRIMDWSQAGMLMPIPNFTLQENILNHGGLANDTSVDNGAILQNLLNNVAGSGTVIYFPAGTYTFKTPVNIPSAGKVVIRGDASNTTLFHFTTGTTNTGNFQIWGGQDLTPIDVLSGATINSQSLTLSDASTLAVGDWIDISQENDSSLMATNNPPNALQVAPRTVGQVMKITAINGNTVTLDRPLHYTYNMNLTVQVNKFYMAEQVGFENFTIRSLNPGDKSHFGFVYCANVWIKCVRSIKSVSCHVNLAMSANCVVRDSYFNDSWDFGNGGHGYGVAITTHSTDNLVENNIIDRMRHAMLVQRGANGNVFGYNYSINATGDGQISIFNRITDISLHGHFNYMNLFEGNVAQEIHAGDTWGPCGFGNTFFRNRLTREGIRISDNSIEQNLVGNDLRKDNTAPFTQNDITIDAGINLLIHGNKEGGVVTWDPNLGSNNLIQSYYLAAKPAFFGSAPWPSLGPEYPTGTIPSEIRQGQGILTECEAQASGISDVASLMSPKVYPNPASGLVTVECGANALVARVYDYTGKLVHVLKSPATSAQLDISSWNTGVYTIAIQSPEGIRVAKLIKL